MSFIFANIFSFLSLLLLIYSSFKKEKKNMLIAQMGNYVFSAIGNLLVGSYAAASANAISILRNWIVTKKNNKVIMISIVIGYATIGLLTNKIGIIGLLPTLASIEYTIFAFFAKTAQQLRYGTIFNLILWLIHDIFVMLYASIIVDVILLVVTIISIIKFWNYKEEIK